MMFRVPRLLLTLSLIPIVPFAASCGGSDTPATENGAGAPPAAMQQYVLQADPGESIGVVAARQREAGTQMVVAGRIARIGKGAAVFWLMDKQLPYCGEVRSEDTCKTPWDYCCETPDTYRANSLLVEIRDQGGQPVPTPSLPGLRLLDHVEVTGTIEKDEQGNPVLLAAGYFRVARPELPDDVRWPQ